MREFCINTGGHLTIDPFKKEQKIKAVKTWYCMALGPIRAVISSGPRVQAPLG